MIDAHTHVGDISLFPDYFLDDLVDNITKQIPQQNARFEMIARGMARSMLTDLDGKRHVADMDLCGIERSVLLTVDLFFMDGQDADHSKIKKVHKAYYERFKKYPDRYILFAGIDPNRGKAGLEILEQCVEKYGFRGLKLYPPTGFDIDDKVVIPYYELCRYYKIPVYFHIGPSAEVMKKQFRYPKSAINIVKKYPDINFILGHAGILYQDESIPIAMEYPNVYLEISGFQRNLDNYNILKEKMEKLMRYIPDNIIFGTDWPLFTAKCPSEKSINIIRKIFGELKVDSGKLFHDNALKALRIE